MTEVTPTLSEGISESLLVSVIFHRTFCNQQDQKCRKKVLQHFRKFIFQERYFRIFSSNDN